MSDSRPPRAWACAGLLVALGGWGAHAGHWPIDWLRVPLALLLGVGVGLPVVLLWARNEPSPLKVLYYASLLSGPLLGAGLWALRTADLLDRSVPFLLAAIAAAQVVVFVRPWHRSPLGRPAHLTIAWALGLAVFLAIALPSGAGSQLLSSPSTLWQLAMSQELLRPGELQNPFLAGTAWPGVGLVESQAAAWALLLDIPTSQALAWSGALAVAGVPIGLYLWGAPLWRDARRCATTPCLALFAASVSVPVGMEPGDMLAPYLVFLSAGRSNWILAYAVGALAAAVHATRHAQSPWVGLCFVCCVLVSTLDVYAGGVLLAGIVASAWIGPSRNGVRTPMLAAGLLAGACSWVFLGWQGLRFPEVAQVEEPAWSTYYVSIVPACLAAAGLGRGRWREAGGAGDEAGRQAILVMSCLALVLALALGFAPVPTPSRTLGWMLASLALGVLAAGGLWDWWETSRVHRAWALLVALTLLAGVGHGLAWVLPGSADLRSRPSEDPAQLALFPEAQEPDFEQQLAVLGPEPPSNVVDPKGALRRMVRWRRDGRDTMRALHWLRDEAPREDRPVLVLAPPDAQSDLKRSHVAAGLAANLPLWVQAKAAFGLGSVRQEPRLEALRVVYGLAKEQPGDPLREVASSGRASYWIVEEADRVRTRRAPGSPVGIETRLVRRGARVVFESGRVEVYRLEPDPR